MTGSYPYTVGCMFSSHLQGLQLDEGQVMLFASISLVDECLPVCVESRSFVFLLIPTHSDCVKTLLATPR